MPLANLATLDGFLNWMSILLDFASGGYTEQPIPWAILSEYRALNGELNICPVILRSPDPIGTTKNLRPTPLASKGRPRFLTEFTLSHRRVRNDTHQSRLISGNDQTTMHGSVTFRWRKEGMAS